MGVKIEDNFHLNLSLPLQPWDTLYLTNFYLLYLLPLVYGYNLGLNFFKKKKIIKKKKRFPWQQSSSSCSLLCSDGRHRSLFFPFSPQQPGNFNHISTQISTSIFSLHQLLTSNTHVRLAFACIFTYVYFLIYIIYIIYFACIITYVFLNVLRIEVDLYHINNDQLIYW